MKRPATVKAGIPVYIADTLFVATRPLFGVFTPHIIYVLIAFLLYQIKQHIMATVQKISANLWFDRQAEDAAKFYTSVFKNSRMGRITHFGKEGFEVHGMPEGLVMTVEFWLEDQAFVALNGGPDFKFNEAVSFIIHCDTQEEVDYYWDKLGEGGDPKAQMCGWLKDKFGLSWQVVPRVLDELIADPDKEKAGRVMTAMLQMKKIEIAPLQKTYEGM